MKKTLRNILIGLITASGLSALYRLLKRQHGPLVRVLCFHDVPDQAWFVDTIAFLEERYHIITPEQFFKKDFQLGKINILLTFDDGYQSWADVALPVLEKYNLTGIFFITSGLLDTADPATFVRQRLKLKRSRTTLTWGGARTLVAAQQVIGGHTVSHPNLATLTKAQVEGELVRDKDRLTTELDTTLQAFAYPFGRQRHYNDLVVEIAQQHYQYAFAAHPGFVVPDTSNHRIPRTCLERNQSPSSIAHFIEGGYDIFNIFKH